MLFRIDFGGFWMVLESILRAKPLLRVELSE